MTLALTVSVTDTLEPPAAPTNVAAAGIANGLRVTWTAPVMTNKPVLEGYDMEHSLRTSADGASPVTWGNPTTIPVGVVEAYEITGLTPGSTYRVRLQAKNDEGPSGWTAYVTGAPSAPRAGNAAPAFTEGANTTRSVAEQTAAGTAIGSPVRATDADNDVLSYALAASGDHAHFAIDSGSGQLRVQGALDYGSRNRYSVVVTVSDGQGGTDRITVTIDVTDATPPTTVTPPTGKPTPPLTFEERQQGDGIARRTVDAAAPVGTAVGAPFRATVPPGMSGPGPFYRVWTTSSPFSVDRLTGQLRTKGPLVRAEYIIELLAFDSQGRIDVIGVIITVSSGRANRDPVFQEGASATRRVAPGASRGVLVGRPVRATDPDGDALFYMLSGADAGSFSIDSGSGQIKVGGPLTERVYSFEVVVGDLKWGVAVLDMTITVTNVVEPPANRAPAFTEGASAGRSVAENTPAGRNIGLPLTASDPDGDQLTYVLGGTDAGHFALAGNQLRTSGALDYEGQSSYPVTVTVSDGRGGTDQISVTISVTNVDEAPVVAPTPANRAPAFTEGASAGRSVAENTPAGRNIGLPLTASDPDGDQLTYVLGGTDAGHFALAGNQLRTSGALDYEGQSSYPVTVTVSDGRGGTDQISVTISVTNVDEAPVVAPTPANRAPAFTEGASAGRSVAENTPAGRNIGLPLTASDPDGDPLTYVLGGTDAGHFALAGNQLRTSGALDYEGQSSYPVTVTVSDGRGGTDQISVTISVTNVDEAPAPPPGAPTNLRVTPGYSNLRLAWDAPDTAGQPPIIRYEVQYKWSIDKNWVDFRTPHFMAKTVTIDIVGRFSYDVRVRAVNANGSSDWVSSSGTPK